MSGPVRRGSRRFVYRWPDVAELLGLSEVTARRYAYQGRFDQTDIHSIIEFRDARQARDMEHTPPDPHICCDEPRIRIVESQARTSKFRRYVECESCSMRYLPFDLDFDRMQSRVVQAAMDISSGVMASASKLLGMTRHRLRRQLERHGLFGHRKNPQR